MLLSDLVQYSSPGCLKPANLWGTWGTTVTLVSTICHDPSSNHMLTVHFVNKSCYGYFGVQNIFCESLVTDARTTLGIQLELICWYATLIKIHCTQHGRGTTQRVSVSNNDAVRKSMALFPLSYTLSMACLPSNSDIIVWILFGLIQDNRCDLISDIHIGFIETCISMVSALISV